MARTPKRPNWTGRLVPITNRPRYELQVVVDALNGKIRQEQVLGEEDAFAEKKRREEAPLILREIVRLWQLSGPNLFRFSVNNRDLWAEVDGYWKTIPLYLVGSPNGGGALLWNDRPSRNPRREALRFFINLLMNPECDKLAGPCERCDRYYIRKTVRNKSYCSRSCGTQATALAATKKTRAEAHANKLRTARALISRYEAIRTKVPWKQWVSLRGEISPRFLTRAVNKGELKTPLRKSNKET